VEALDITIKYVVVSDDDGDGGFIVKEKRKSTLSVFNFICVENDVSGASVRVANVDGTGTEHQIGTHTDRQIDRRSVAGFQSQDGPFAEDNIALIVPEWPAIRSAPNNKTTKHFRGANIKIKDAE
jgi:hypothetical protein